MITVVDYGMGNLRSVAKALEKVGLDVKVSSDPEDVLNSKAIVVPGVGAFGDAMHNLDRLGLLDPVIRSIESGKPYLGICLGLQILFEYGYEFGEHKGLGVLRGKVIRFENREGFKVPHMGWNQVWIKQKDGLFSDIKDGEYYYFVHSFYAVPSEESDIASTTDYITEFCSAVQKGNVWAVQFHPEKSQKAGLKLLENFKGFVEKES
ncbi:MAG TPA: imidazole glycerol phosphate synthase subunit HisH [Persephonella sp.]|uniref:Imidazole glycerol phosphate synthase subunit HisH n=1 Tax=Persephonella marina (strain DSM 14350 / EX-H1) TaxID=123214 RepID=C0QR01_PERMH|nr:MULTISPECIES: imidazole glycerol phosphate synthase subunit HisH [Persephonella]ACO04674.1 imidazole glycerol phosphate synthase, glutamine amidotransferase subunit [Persephonella marina EX-H1]HCB68846.1 imidazole glycerol phosphate synthase subunit HisH [Persephonella sp.]